MMYKNSVEYMLYMQNLIVSVFKTGITKERLWHNLFYQTTISKFIMDNENTNPHVRFIFQYITITDHRCPNLRFKDESYPVVFVFSDPAFINIPDWHYINPPRQRDIFNENAKRVDASDIQSNIPDTCVLKGAYIFEELYFEDKRYKNIYPQYFEYIETTTDEEEIKKLEEFTKFLIGDGES